MSRERGKVGLAQHAFGRLPAYYREFALAVALAMGIHALIGGFFVLFEERVEEVIQRITFEAPPPPSFFVKPPMATTKALEFRKVPLPEDYFSRQEKKTTRARVSEVQALAALRTDAVLERLDVSEVAPSALGHRGGLAVRSDEVGAGGVEGFALGVPALKVEAVSGVKEARQQIDMKLDMLSVKNMDTGQYQAMVIQDPNNRRQIKGFLHIAQAYSEHHSNQLHYTQVHHDVNFSQLDELIKALKDYTGIEADYLGAVPLSDPRLLDIPWLMLENISSRDIGSAELENLGRYLAGGGFAVAQLSADSGANETLKRQTGIFDVLRRAMKAQGLNEGADWKFVVLEGEHPIYHAFFDFDSAVRANQIGQHSSHNPLSKDLGMEVRGRLAVFLNAGPELEASSGTMGLQHSHLIRADATRSLQFALNTIVFALTQEGSVTQQLMAGVR